MTNKKRLALSVALSLTMSCMFSMTVAAEVIYYDGSHPELLRPDPWFTSDPRPLALFSDRSLNNNTITVNMGGRNNILNATIYGGISISEKPVVVSGNNLQIYNAAIDNEIFGGYSKIGVVKDNHVVMKNAIATYGLQGGWSEDGDVTNNSLTLVDITAKLDVCGGNSSNGNSFANQVNITKGIIDANVRGGMSDGGSSDSNKVILNETDVKFSVYGGLSFGGGNANNNSVTADNTKIIDTVTGGLSGEGDANGNSVILNATTSKSVIGGEGKKGNADSNSVTMSNNTEINGKVIGGYSGTGHANSNAVMLSDTTIKTYVAGGHGETGANGNSVILSAVEAETVIGGNAYTGNANSNRVILSNNSKVTDSVYGGSTNAGNADGNIVTMRDTDGIREIRGGMSYAGNANSNKITLSENSVADFVTGGYSFAGGNANNNSITLGKNNTVVGTVIGGVSNEGNATNNTVNVNGTNDLTDSEIYGGYSDEDTTGRDLFTGNTLNWASMGTATQVANFEYYNFTIPENAVDGKTLLTIGGTEKTDLSKSHVRLAGVKNASQWQAGDKIILLDNQHGIEGVDSTVSGNARKGIKRHTYEIEKIDNGKKLEATITGFGVADQAKSLSEGRIAAIGFINSAVDLATGSGLQNAMDSSADKYDIFGAMNYGDLRYDSGSNADVKGTSMLLGFSRKLNAQKGSWVVGAFLESGNSTYETFNSFADGDNVRAHGKNNYFGGGIMARNIRDNGVYLEGSARVGRMSSDYDSSELETKYDMKSTYYGLHMGLGKLFELNKTTQLDVYGKYFWSHQGASTVSINGEDFNFEALNSHRLRIGARVNLLGGGNGLKTYFGLAYEQEFSGNARATYSSENIAAPSIKGATGIGEIGITYKPSSKSAFSMDVGLNGYVGKRQGIGGGIRINWGF